MSLSSIVWEESLELSKALGSEEETSDDNGIDFVTRLWVYLDAKEVFGEVQGGQPFGLVKWVCGLLS